MFVLLTLLPFGIFVGHLADAGQQTQFKARFSLDDDLTMMQNIIKRVQNEDDLCEFFRHVLRTQLEPYYT